MKALSKISAILLIKNILNMLELDLSVNIKAPYFIVYSIIIIIQILDI